MAGFKAGDRHDDGFVVSSGHSGELPPSIQVRIRRLYMEGHTYREIQQLLGASSKTVAKYLRPITRGIPVDPEKFWRTGLDGEEMEEPNQ